ncbi:transcriptional regulator [Pasteurellaceae bacterium 15-036681]|nr:transcriptional regulator [Pasteurellaceae bacterium 15-036681]
MARKQKSEQAKQDTEQVKQAAEQVKQESEQAKTAEADGVDSGASDAELDGNVIQPIAFDVTLKSIHPQLTYGRCGYRFNKENAVQIPFDDLTGEQVAALAEDPYLDFVPVVEG